MAGGAGDYEEPAHDHCGFPGSCSRFPVWRIQHPQRVEERSCHNPAYFPDPEKFDPSRFEGSGPSPFVWLPFGAGPRICLGNEFARTEIAVFLHHIALQFKWEMVDPQEAISINPLSIFKHGMQLNIWKSEGQKQGN